MPNSSFSGVQRRILPFVGTSKESKPFVLPKSAFWEYKLEKMPLYALRRNQILFGSFLSPTCSLKINKDSIWFT